ncbi:MAG: SEL1-like repeat protein, partial [Synergistaceae bacterium]|nr:SEL1-like repeat protein [Synergistaceae bacterium]
MEDKVFKYYAFISYSHNDKKIAKKLHVWLEHYNLPSKVIGSHPDLPKKLRPVFIDESDLVDKKGSLSEALKGYLNESQYLILICSPSSAKSPYVNDEVDYFMNELERGDRIIPLIVDGLPHAKDESIECFPPAILELDREHEPLGIDLKTFKRRGAFLRVMATLLRLEIDYFISRAEEERKRRNRILSAVGAVLSVIAGVFAWHEIEAFRVLREAEAQSNLGSLYLATKDYVKAAELLEKAAAKGHAKAQYNLGYMYEHGEGVKQDYAKARELYEKAAAQGNA